MASYREDLAYIHHVGFSGFALNAAPGLLSLLRRHSIHGGLVVDLGCGTGIWARQLGFASYDVLGVDVSPSMIRLARETAPQARFVRQSLVDVRLPDCRAVTSIGECFSYSFAGDEDGSLIAGLFGRVFRALSPGGLFLFDFAQSGRYPGGMPRSGHWTGDDWAILLDAEEDRDRHLITRELTAFRKIDGQYRRSDETHILRTYDTDELQATLVSAGFEAKPIRGYGPLRFRAGQAGMLARKPVP